MRILALPLLAASIGCVGVKTIPPPGAPLAIEPRNLTMTQGPAPKGSGTVILDVVGRSAHAFAVQKPNTIDESLILLCDTPCSVNLLEGTHLVRFVDQKDAHLKGDVGIVVTGGTTLVRHALGYEHLMPEGIGLAGIMLGGAGLVGIIMGPAMLASGGDATNRTIAALVLGFGVAFIGGSWALLRYGRTERQQGATTTVKLR